MALPLVYRGRVQGGELPQLLPPGESQTIPCRARKKQEHTIERRRESRICARLICFHTATPRTRTNTTGYTFLYLLDRSEGRIPLLLCFSLFRLPPIFPVPLLSFLFDLNGCHSSLFFFSLVFSFFLSPLLSLARIVRCQDAYYKQLRAGFLPRSCGETRLFSTICVHSLLSLLLSLLLCFPHLCLLSCLWRLGHAECTILSISLVLLQHDERGESPPVLHKAARVCWE